MINNKRGNYFIMDNNIFSLKLKPGEFVVYVYLQRRANIKTGQCWLSYQTIAHETNMSKNSVARHVAALEERGLVMTERTFWSDQSGNNMNGYLLFTLLPLSEVMEADYQRQLAKLEADTERRRVQEN